MLSFLFSALLFAADPVAAAPTTTAQPVKTAEKPQKEKKVCRIPLEQTGTRMQRRICLTESEWATRDEGSSAEDLKTLGSR